MAVGLERATERPRATEHGFRTDVQGLRALAVTSVVLYHFQLPPFTGGYVGVDVFFVISGFVITRLLLREREQTGGTSIPSFYARRVRRILPAATLAVAATVVASYLLLGSVGGGAIARDGIAASLFYANVHFAHSANSYLLSSALPSPLQHFWSLSIEEQFYVVWPTAFLAICALAGARARRGVQVAFLAAVIAGAMALSVSLTASNPSAAYYSSFIRAGELALGALVAVAAPLLTRLPSVLAACGGWLGLAGILVAAVAYNDRTAYPGIAVVLPVVATALVIACGSTTSRWSPTGVLSLRGIVALGALSYSLYLWHWPLFALVQLRLGYAPSWPWRVVLLVPALGLAIASYHLVERPFRSSKAFVEHRRWTFAFGITLIGAVLIVIALCEAVGATTGPIAATPPPATGQAQLASDLAKAATIRTLPALAVPLSQVASDVTYASFDRGCLIADTATTALGSRPKDCYFGDVAAHRTLVLYGDSNADMWVSAFSELGMRDHFRVALLARASCQVPDLDLWDPAVHQPGTACTAFRQWVFGEVAHLQPFATVVVDYEYGLRWNYQDQLLSPATADAGVTATIHALAHSGTRVVMLGMAPAEFQDPVECLQLHQSDIQACASPVACLTVALQSSPQCTFAPATGRTWAEVDLLPGAVARGGGTYMSVTPLFCTASDCPPVVDHLVVNYDLRHVTQHFANFIALALGQRLEASGVALTPSP